MTIDFERASELSRRPNGKFQPIVSTLERPA
jgi:hypothetical protein